MNLVLRLEFQTKSIGLDSTSIKNMACFRGTDMDEIT